VSDFDLLAILARIEAAAPAAVEAALQIGAAASAQQVPVDTGALLASQEIEAGPEGGSVSYNTDYAAVQHDRLTNHHPNGGNAKYLEIPWLASAVPMVEAAAAVLRKAI
jgi:hypothetical protein